MIRAFAKSNCRKIAWRLVLLAAAVASSSPLATRAAEDSAESSVALTADERASVENSLRFYSELIEKEPDDVSWRMLRMSCRRKLGDSEGAAQDLAVVRMLDPHEADVEEGRQSFWSRDLETAHRFLSRAIDSEPSRSADAYYYRALVYSEQRRFRHALIDIARSLEVSEPLSQDVCRTCYQQAKIYHHLGQYENAVAAATNMIDRHFEIAIDDAKRGLPIFPLNPHYYFLRASSYMELREYRRASDDFTTCEELGARWPEMYDERANCFRELGEVEREKVDRAQAAKLQAAEKQARLPEPGLIDLGPSVASSHGKASPTSRADAPLRRGATNLLRGVIRR